MEYNDKVQTYLEIDGVEKEDDRSRAFQDMKSKYRKTMAQTFIVTLLWIKSFQMDPIYESIKKIASDLRLAKYYDDEEAWKYASEKRKYLFDTIIKRYDPLR